MSPPSRLPKTSTDNGGKKSAKRKADAISIVTPMATDTPTQSGFTISSLPQDLTQSTPKPASPADISLPHLDRSNLPSSETISLVSQSHTLTPISILSSTQITKRVTKILAILSQWPAKNGEKEQVVTLYAKGDVGAKLITVVEIAKREVAGKGGKWFQYSCVEGKVEEVKKRKEKKGGGQSDQKKNGDGGEDGEEEGFEVMKTPFERAIEGRPKVREVPVLIVYLSRVRIEILRKKYGEQTNAEPVR